MIGFNRITFDSNMMGGRACIRGIRVTVSLILNLVANGMSDVRSLMPIRIWSVKIFNKRCVMPHGLRKNRCILWNSRHEFSVAVILC